MDVQLGLLAFVVASAAYTFLGWQCWTGRWRFWLKHPGGLDAWWPAGLFLGLTMLLFSVAALAGWLLEDAVAPDWWAAPILTAVVGIGLFAGVLLGIPMLLAIGQLTWVEDTYRTHPDGTRLTRLLLPGWYRQHLAQRVAALPPTGAPDREASDGDRAS